MLTALVFSLRSYNREETFARIASLSPDLVVQNLSYTFIANSTTYTTYLQFSGFVMNSGVGVAVTSKPRLRIDFHNNGSWDIVVPLTQNQTGSLAPGASESEVWNVVSEAIPWVAVGGFHRFEICTDVQNNVIESNESNNCAPLLFNNNFVYVVAHDASAGEPANSGIFRLRRSAPSSATPVYFTISGNAVGGVDYQSIQSPQVISGLPLYLDIPLTPIDDNVAEPQETAILTIDPSVYYQVAPQNSSGVITIDDNDFPDLIVVSPWTNGGNSSTSTGQTTYDFSAVVRNMGNVLAGSSSRTKLQVDFNTGTQPGWDVEQTAITGNLSPNASEIESWSNIVGPATSGTYRAHIFRICADTLNQIIELSEINNCSNDIPF
ncbi:MAG: CARDB domain-containing protein [Patescibacteria group bacterium]